MVLRRFLKLLGPGILYAGAAIGVSHLVQSTRAGAEYGWWPIAAIVFIHIAKYPFFRAGPEYASATGQSLIQGYRNRGVIYLILFLVFTVGTMFAIIAAIVSVTGGITSYLFHLETPPLLVSAGILVLSTFLLILGGYDWLNRSIKAIILLLGVCTIVAFAAAFFVDTPVQPMDAEPIFDGVFLIMMIKLMGWMPAPLDLSVWHSLWALEKQQNSATPHDWKESMRDFNFGFWGTMVMGILFLGMGAMLLNHETEVPASGVAFSKMLLGMYTTALGDWALAIVGIAALATMISTTLTCMDAIPRSLAETVRVLGGKTNKMSYPFFLLVLAGGSFALLSFLSASMTKMVDIATVLSFCSAPVLAFMNFRVMRGKEVPKKYQPRTAASIYELVSILTLVILTVLFLRTI